MQVIVLWTRSLLDYLLFVDLDCTGLAYDGVSLYGTDRALLSHLSKYSYVTASMLQIRKDTPCRVGKKAQLGYGSFVTSAQTADVALVAQSEQWQKALRQSYDVPPEFFNDGLRLRLTTYGGIDSIEDFVDALTRHTGSYSETKLPRGHDVTPEVVQAFLVECHAAARRQGHTLIAHDMTRLVGIFPMTFPIANVGEKLVIKSEAWWRQWDMV